MAKTPGTTTKASDLQVQVLEKEGVEFIFGMPGEENLDLVESLRTSGIRLILTRHEQGAAFQAGGVHLFDLPVGYSEDQHVLIDELAAKACLL